MSNELLDLKARNASLQRQLVDMTLENTRLQRELDSARRMALDAWTDFGHEAALADKLYNLHVRMDDNFVDEEEYNEVMEAYAQRRRTQTTTGDNNE